MNDERCKNCRFWVEDLDEDGGWCHRYPPTFWLKAHQYPDYTSFIQPITLPTDWCGEFRAKEKTP